MKLITNKEFKIIEDVRKQLCSDYLKNSDMTQKLYRIVYRKRGLKYLLNCLTKW